MRYILYLVLKNQIYRSSKEWKSNLFIKQTPEKEKKTSINDLSIKKKLRLELQSSFTYALRAFFTFSDVICAWLLPPSASPPKPDQRYDGFTTSVSMIWSNVLGVSQQSKPQSKRLSVSWIRSYLKEEDGRLMITLKKGQNLMMSRR